MWRGCMIVAILLGKVTCDGFNSALHFFVETRELQGSGFAMPEGMGAAAGWRGGMRREALGGRLVGGRGEWCGKEGEKGPSGEGVGWWRGGGWVYIDIAGRAGMTRAIILGCAIQCRSKLPLGPWGQVQGWKVRGRPAMGFLPVSSHSF